MTRAESYEYLTKLYGRPAVAIGDALYRLKSVPGTILVCGLVIGGIAWIEARDRLAKTASRIKEILHGSSKQER